MKIPFLDCETTGLSPEKDRLLEVGIVVVDIPTFAIVHEDHRVFHYDIKKPHGYIHPKVIEMHTVNGLWDACKISLLDDYQKMDQIIAQILVDNGCQGAVLAGANPDFDRRFLRNILPQTDKLLHYRNFDTNTFWLLQEFLTGESGKRAKPASHRAVDDCKDAVAVVEKHFDFMCDFMGLERLKAELELARSALEASRG